MAKLLGSIEPRIWTPPLRKLTRRTSEGFTVCDWLTNDLEISLLPHQKWWFNAVLEKLPGGKYRFRQCLTTMPRRNTKTSLATFLAAYQLTHGVKSVLISSAQLDTARESYLALEELILDHPQAFGKAKFRRVNGQYEINLLDHKSRFKIISANRRGGRGLSAGLAIEDELREARDWDGHSAIEPTTTAVPNSQLHMTSNAGDRDSVVLNHFRARAIEGSDPHLFIAEWSAPDGCEIDDPQAWAIANPALGRLFGPEALEAAMSKPASAFRTENLNQSVPNLNEAVDKQAWGNCYDPGTLDAHRSRVAVGIDMSPDGRHITMVAAASLPDGRIRVETVAAWESTLDMRRDLPDLLARIKPRGVAWFPTAAAAISTDMKEIRNNQELTGSEVTAACAGLADLIGGGRIAHNGDELLATHILGAQKLPSGDGWKFSRKGGWCDAAYSTAGAVQLARKFPPPSRLRVLASR